MRIILQRIEKRKIILRTCERSQNTQITERFIHDRNDHRLLAGIFLLRFRRSFRRPVLIKNLFRTLLRIPIRLTDLHPLPERDKCRSKTGRLICIRLPPEINADIVSIREIIAANPEKQRRSCPDRSAALYQDPFLSRSLLKNIHLSKRPHAGKQKIQDQKRKRQLLRDLKRILPCDRHGRPQCKNICCKERLSTELQEIIIERTDKPRKDI